jgi:TolB protein
MKRWISALAVTTWAIVVVTTAIPAHATAPGKNGRIAFRRYFNEARTYGAIFTINADGNGERQVTHPPRGVLDDEPDWSPDGRWITYTRVPGGSTIGEILAQPRHIFRIRANGTGRLDLSKATCPGPTAPVRPDKCVSDIISTWSPRGDEIAFTRELGNPGVRGTVDIFVMRADGTNVRRITDSGLRYEDFNAQWAPDGTRLSFSRYDERRDTNAIFTVGLDGTNLQRITPWGFSNQPDWFPDGSWIVCNRIGGHYDLWRVHPDGTGLERITHTSEDDVVWGPVSVSPDGTMFTASRAPGVGAAGNFDVYTLSIDGTELQDVTNSVAWDGAPDWGPRPGPP